MGEQVENSKGKWLALTAALLGWMFDGLEMALFPLVARPAIGDLLQTTDAEVINKWFNIATASFLVGAATGGVLFGWLGDRLGRVKAMTLSVLTYSLFSGAGGFVNSPEQIAILRFVAALGMGGEWALGVALVMEIWPDKSRAFMAGLIGAAANVGYMLMAVIGLGLQRLIGPLRESLLEIGLGEETTAWLTRNNGWRILMMCGALPALLTFAIRLFVPESERWKHEEKKGGTSHWRFQDLAGVGGGAVAGCVMIYVWAEEFALPVRLLVSLVCLVCVLVGYSFPVFMYLRRAAGPEGGTGAFATKDVKPILMRMLLGACLGGVALLATWGSIQRATVWAGSLPKTDPTAAAWTQFWSAVGAILGTILGALIAGRYGRRLSYSLLCITALLASVAFFQLNKEYGPLFLVTVFFAGGLSASFYGWLPLYLPELFPTAVRAFGQGFSFNFGRILAAVGTLQMGALVAVLSSSGSPAEAIPQACTILSFIYLVGLGLIWLAPETHGKPLPE